MVLEGKRPPYVPWHITLTQEAEEKLKQHCSHGNLESFMGNHLKFQGNPVGYMTYMGDHRYQDHFGVIWNRSIDKDIGVVENCLLPEASLKGFCFPDPEDPMLYAGMSERTGDSDNLFRIYPIGFSLFERAWTLRGMERLYMDMVDNPKFVHQLFSSLADYTLEVVHRACDAGTDAVYFGDDWGAQHGLLMGPSHWYEFIYPQVKRLYQAVRSRGAYVFIHSCGDVDELFDSLIEAGLSCFNPFQPEVMDVFSLLESYRGKLAFFGGLSTQQTLPFGSTDDVRDAVHALLKAGKPGGYICSPAHAVEGDVPVENMIALIETLQEQLR